MKLGKISFVIIVEDIIAAVIANFAANFYMQNLQKKIIYYNIL